MAETDIEALVPAVERALARAGATGLDPVVIYGLVADALADVALYAGSVFGKKLVVTARDSTTQAPESWATSDLLTEEETSVIRAQAALNFFFYEARDRKISERISDESGEWEYSLSSMALRDQLKQLIAERDRALAALERDGAALDTYESFIAVRDQLVSQITEPWVTGNMGLGGFTDYRFGQ